MADTNTELVIKTFDKLSETYTNRFTSDAAEKAKMQALLALWGLQPNTTLLEVGGGTGDLTPLLLERIGLGGCLTFLDIAPKMVTKAQEKLAVYNNVNFVVGDIHNITFPYTFDAIVIFNAFPHFRDKYAAFANCYKLLKNKGKLIIAHNNSRNAIIGCHQRKRVEDSISVFPEDSYVSETLKTLGYTVAVFDTCGDIHYLVVAMK